MTDKPTMVPPKVDMSTAPTQRQYGNPAYKNKQASLTFYKLNTRGEVEPGKFNYTISKFDADLNLLSSYNMTFIPSNNGGYYDCNCPASKFDCRHKGIQRAILQAGMADSEKFYCFEAGTFKRAEDIT